MHASLDTGTRAPAAGLAPGVGASVFIGALVFAGNRLTDDPRSGESLRRRLACLRGGAAEGQSDDITHACC
ncbi:MAG: hypothetical protein R3E12_02060 [Candidatus Eisenbacteria bacterium]